MDQKYYRSGSRLDANVYSHAAALTLRNTLSLIPDVCKSQPLVPKSARVSEAVWTLVHAGICLERGSEAVEHLDFICEQSGYKSRNSR